jgi:hypothetical protein
LLGFNLDYQIRGSLSNYLEKEYVCVSAGDKKIPLAIFNSTDDMIRFGEEWFKPYSDTLKGKIENQFNNIFFIYTKVWQEVIDDVKVNNFIRSEEGSIISKSFINANDAYLKLFPEDKGKTF